MSLPEYSNSKFEISAQVGVTTSGPAVAVTSQNSVPAAAINPIMRLPVIFLILGLASIAMSGRPGGTGAAKPADDESQNIADQVERSHDAFVLLY